MVKIDSLSKNIIRIMLSLKENDGLVKLLVNNSSTPFVGDIPSNRNFLIDPKNPNSKISPCPFDPEAEIEASSFIRVYYNEGDFNENETIQEMQLHIDIIVAKSLWLINDGKVTNQYPNGDGESLIRPYEIMSRVIDTIGRRGISNATNYVKIDGWRHLSVNTKFDAIRLYSEYFSVEA